MPSPRPELKRYGTEKYIVWRVLREIQSFHESFEYIFDFEKMAVYRTVYYS